MAATASSPPSPPVLLGTAQEEFQGKRKQSSKLPHASSCDSSATWLSTSVGTSESALPHGVSSSSEYDDKKTAAVSQALIDGPQTEFVHGGLEQGPDLPQRGAFKEEFELKRRLGEGAFGIVHSCVARGSGKEYAVKIVKHALLHPLDQQSLLTEIRLQKALPAHEHIVSLHASFDEEDSMKLVMDLCRGEDLYSLIDDAKQRHRWRGGDCALSDPAAANVGRQLLVAIGFCHAHGVVHRDVKPENVLLVHPEKQVRLHTKEMVIKLCDFGYAAEFSLDEPAPLLELVGSADYVAPEVARQERYGRGVDVWSAGAVLFECLRGRAPFAADTEHETLKLVRKAELAFDDGWSKLSEQGQACVRHLMQVEAAARPTAEAALGHPWFRGA